MVGEDKVTGEEEVQKPRVQASGRIICVHYRNRQELRQMQHWRE